MTETKWTPGPWTVDRPSDQNQRMHVVREFNWRLVASMENYNKYLAYAEEKRANANLISAAPDLYASVERLLLEFDFMIERGVIPDVRDDIIFDNARAAMRKARGE